MFTLRTFACIGGSLKLKYTVNKHNLKNNVRNGIEGGALCIWYII